MESVRGKNVFVIQPTSNPVNEHLMELLIIIDSLKRTSAGRINAVLPYYGYARQDRKAAPREPITSKLVADLITAAGAHSVLTVDLHSPQIQGFFNIPHTHLTAMYTIANYFKKRKLSNLVIVAPDAGSANKTKKFADLLECPFVLMHKKRPKHNEAKILNIIGNVKGKNALIFDDMIDTAGTMVAAVETIKEKGAKDVYIAATHGIFTPPAIEQLKKSSVAEVIVTNTIDIPKSKQFKRLTTLSLGRLIAEAIKCSHTHKSISEIFSTMNKSISGTEKKITEF